MLRRLTLGCAVALASAAPAHASQILKLDLAAPANAAPRGVAVQSAPLRRGTAYVVVVSGTGSLWGPDSREPVTCGAPEAGATITEPTPGRAAAVPTVDAALVYAVPRGMPFLGGYACIPPTPKSPPAQAALRMGTAGALSAVTPIGGQPTVAAPDHRYAYAVRGRGRPLQLQYADPLVYDNSGLLTVSIFTKRECAAVRCQPALRAQALSLGARPLPCVFAELPATASHPADRELCR